MNSQERPIVLGFIGSGKSTHRYHAPYLRVRTSQYKIKTIFSPHAPLTPWKKLPRVLYTSQRQELLEDPDIELIVIASPVQHHYQDAYDALTHGKHVLLEKPFTETLAQAQALFELAKAKHRSIEAFQNRRYDSDYLTTLDVIHRGLIGNLVELNMHFDYDRSEVIAKISSASFSEGIFYGHGAHSLDQAIAAFGVPQKAIIDVRALHPNRRFNDYFDCVLFYPGFKVNVRSSYHRVVSRPSFEAFGLKGHFIKERLDRQELDLKRFRMPSHPTFGQDRPRDYGILSTRRADGQVEQCRIPTLQGDYGRVYDGIYHRFRHGHAARVTPEQTLELMRLLEMGAQNFTP